MVHGANFADPLPKLYIKHNDLLFNHHDDSLTKVYTTT